MSGIHSDNDKIDKLVNLSGAENSAAEKLRQAARKDPSIAQAVGRLTDSDIARITALLSDKQALARLMSSPKAKDLLKKFNR